MINLRGIAYLHAAQTALAIQRHRLAAGKLPIRSLILGRLTSMRCLWTLLTAMKCDTRNLILVL
jgi:hypothetical protein